MPGAGGEAAGADAPLCPEHPGPHGLGCAAATEGTAELPPGEAPELCLHEENTDKSLQEELVLPVRAGEGVVGEGLCFLQIFRVVPPRNLFVRRLRFV